MDAHIDLNEIRRLAGLQEQVDRRTILKVACSYQVEVSKEEFLRVLDLDVDNEPNLGDLLSDIEGVEEVEYHPHFGPYYFLTLSVDHDTSQTWQQIQATIDQYLG